MEVSQIAKLSFLVDFPVMHYPQGPTMGNPHVEHKYQWTIPEMESSGDTLIFKGEVVAIFQFPPKPVERHSSDITLFRNYRTLHSWPFVHLVMTESLLRIVQIVASQIRYGGIVIREFY